MEFKVIDFENWNRKEYFEHYYKALPCTYSMTVKIDITNVIVNEIEIYPIMIYAITKIVNAHEEFRMAIDETGKIGFYNRVLPSYTVFNKETETFFNLWTNYDDDFSRFLENYRNDLIKYKNSKNMEPKANTPRNVFPISMIPWESFDGFNLNLQKGYDFLLPIFTIGKYYQEGKKHYIPLAIQVHHGVCDGYHVCRFVNELRNLLLDM